MSERIKLIHLVVGFFACIGLVGLAYASKHWELGVATQGAIGGFLGLVLWQVRSVLFRSSPPAPPANGGGPKVIVDDDDRARPSDLQRSWLFDTFPEWLGAKSYRLVLWSVMSISIMCGFALSTSPTTACTPQVRTAVEQGLADIGKCVLQQATAGAPNPAAILAACVGSTIDDIISVLDAFLVGHPGAAVDATPDAKSQYVELGRLLRASKAHKAGVQ